MSNVFIIGGAGSIWQKEYIKNIHENDNVFLFIFQELDEGLKNEYDELKINLINIYGEYDNSSKLKRAKNMIRYAYKLKKKIDFIEFHIPAANIQSIFVYLVMKIIGCDAITVFWGSDILRLKKNKAKYINPAIKNSKYICLGTEDMQEKFKQIFGNKYNDKFKNVKFGSLAIESIKKIEVDMSKEECKEWFNLPINKKVIAIGYNGEQAQQHEKILRSLDKLNEIYKSKIHLLIHYSGEFDIDYNEKIIKLLNASKITYTVLESRYSFDEVAKLRLATDIFIQGQISDGLSSTMRELFYAKAVIINPTWIGYKELDKVGVNYYKYNDFDEIIDILISILDNRSRISIENNSEIIDQKFSWRAVKKDWMDMFNEGIS